MEPNYEPTPLGQTLDRLLSFMGAPPVAEFSELRESWELIVGPLVAEHVKPVQLKNGVLLLACKEPAWASQMQWSEDQILTQYRSRFPDSTVGRIQTRVVLDQ